MKRNGWIAVLVLGCSVLLGGCGAADQAYQKGIAALQKGQYAQAAPYFQKAIKKNQERAEYYIAYGMSLNGQQKYEEALQQFANAYQDTENTIANANNKQVYYGEAISYYYLQEYEKSLSLCEKALQYTSPDTLDGAILCSRGAALESLNRQEEATVSYQKAIRKDSQNWQAYYRLSAIYEAQGEDDAAAQSKEFLVNAYQDGREAVGYYLGMLCAEAGESDQAREYLTAYVASDPSEYLAETYRVLAEIAMQENDVEQAEEYLAKGRESAGGAVQQEIWRTQVILLEQQGLFGEALLAVEEYLGQYPQDQEMKREKRFLKTRDTVAQGISQEDSGQQEGEIAADNTSSALPETSAKAARQTSRSASGNVKTDTPETTGQDSEKATVPEKSPAAVQSSATAAPTAQRQENTEEIGTQTRRTTASPAASQKTQAPLTDSEETTE